MPQEIVAIFGVYRLDDPFEVERVVLIPKKIIIHEEWNPLVEIYNADISLLKLVFLNIDHVYITPICIYDSIDDPLANEGVVLGWGQSKDTPNSYKTIPEQTKVTIYNNEECFLEDVALHKIANNRTFCAGTKDLSGSCSGDHGSGIFIKVDGIYYLKGLLSTGPITSFGQCETSRYAMYTNIHKFTDWIKLKTQGAFAISAKGDLNSF